MDHISHIKRHFSKLNNPLKRLLSLTKSYLLVALLFGCASVKKIAIDRDVSDILKRSEVFSNHFTGFSLFDIESNEFIADHNSTLLFTPASNTKILCMYVSLKSFGDSIPGILYKELNDKLIVQPIGDPTFLLEGYSNQPVYDLLANYDMAEIVWPSDELSPFGSGWAWDDYEYDFQSARAWWPIYGNAISVIKKKDSISITPSFFNDFVETASSSDSSTSIARDWKHNLFKVEMGIDTSSFVENIPFEYSKELLLTLLSDTLGTKLSFGESLMVNPDTMMSQPIDLVLAKMMKPSSNFLAEQLLILAAWKNGFAEIRPFINEVKTIWLSDLNEMVWVDGSGLSRYNLIAPVDQVRLLKKCYDEFGWERIKNILPTGGEGTLEEWYLSEEPYIYAKTGTLSNNHNISGFLETKSGKRLIFSLMNNHYARPTVEVKRAMEDFLNQIREAY